MKIIFLWFLLPLNLFLYLIQKWAIHIPSISAFVLIFPFANLLEPYLTFFRALYLWFEAILLIKPTFYYRRKKIIYQFIRAGWYLLWSLFSKRYLNAFRAYCSDFRLWHLYLWTINPFLFSNSYFLWFPSNYWSFILGTISSLLANIFDHLFLCLFSRYPWHPLDSLLWKVKSLLETPWSKSHPHTTLMCKTPNSSWTLSLQYLGS